MLTRLVATMGMVAGCLVFASPSADAAAVCLHYEKVRRADGQIEVVCTEWSDDPGVDPSGGPDGPDGGPRTCTAGAEDVDCEGPAGAVWHNGENCWISRAQPQPDPPGAKTPEDGAWYDCMTPRGTGGGTRQVWLDGPAPTPGVPPSVAAQQVIARMSFEPPTIGIVPESGDDKMGLIGMPTWMWVENPTNTTYGPQHVSESAFGMTIVIDAKVSKVEWDMGDGAPTVICGEGVPYQDAFGAEDSPSCGHRYERTSAGQPDNAYKVQAVAYWDISWTAGGWSGSQTMALRSQTQIRVGEMQVLVQ